MLRVNSMYHISYLRQYKYTISATGIVYLIARSSNTLIISDGEMDLKGE